MDITLTSEQIKLVNILNHFFVTPQDYAAGKLFYTTMEVFAKLQSIYPSDSYSPEQVTEVLLYLKIETINGAADKIFWYLQER
ncbi:hypothetical protein [Pedobacter gandavensis]|uniref:Uncharacterized protein n=1 Tax=Pedobacter gandavensis TaxID=2679963 RepID=A0ABR6EV70_9SPHI|nr:hypothetical protein [Pedobacter gandavensis]MBB2149166.1 hypothetical protein [Pedobacter gandavensis]